MAKIIFNRYIPVKGNAMNFFGLIFVRKDYPASLKYAEKIMNHEMIHTAQMRELLFIPFYVLYICEWLIRLIISPRSAYRNISFEREAYANESNFEYLSNRKHFSAIKYIKK